MQTKPTKTIAVLCYNINFWDNFVAHKKHKLEYKEINRSNRTLLDLNDTLYVCFLTANSLQGYRIDDFIIEADNDNWRDEFINLIAMAKIRKSIGR